MKLPTTHPVRKIFYLIIAVAFLLLALVFNVIQKNIEMEAYALTLFKDIAVIVGFMALFLFIKLYWKRESFPLKRLVAILILSVLVLVITLLISQILPAEFETKSYQLIPIYFFSIIVANAISTVLGVGAIIILLLLKDVIFYKRRSYTGRNFLFLIIGLIAASISTVDLGPYESGTVSYLLYGVLILLILLNSFRLSWIVYLSKKEKILTIVYSFFLFILFIGLKMNISESANIGKYLLYYSFPLKTFIDGTFLFGAIYFGIAFIGTLFHLPTAEAFDRKRSEVSSLHYLSKLVTQVFDFEELVNSVTGMTLQVCEAKSSWLEIIQTQAETIAYNNSFRDSNHSVLIVANRNIAIDEIKKINAISREIESAEVDSIRKALINEKKPIVIDNTLQDRRTKHIKEFDIKIGSMLVVPLISHKQLIGILYATKDIEYGFDREDVDVISAFADQAAIAIDNSRLIEKSLERERLVREMTVAQEMQKKLLPQRLPTLDQIELEALSTPAFEVGGDYYDFVLLDNNKLAIVIGDVSGKGVSAAFYMAEMKGIFQSICNMYSSPKEFITRANQAISTSIDKRSFISLIYAVLDLDTGVLTSARAGHCPFLIASKDRINYVRTEGIGIGVGASTTFERYIKEEETQLQYGDVCVFYTDGITEAMPPEGEEFGYARLMEVVQKNYYKSALEIRDEIIHAVNQHMKNKSPQDDITIIILKWLKN
jgi:serine phosphatase RsbU (regulator of sigma subunit)/MFS family permease